MVLRRQVDPLSEAAARQAALRGATLLVLVSIVMAGAPLERGGVSAVAAPSAQREARLVGGGEARQAVARQDRSNEDCGAAAAAVVGGRGDGAGSGAVVTRPPERTPSVRAPVRVALLDLPPPSAA